MITNGNSILVGDNTSLPNMATTLEGWFQNLVIGIISTVMVNNRVAESVTEIATRGVLQPLTQEKLEIKPEGERSWKWYMLHCQPSLSLKTDDTVTIKGDRFRVMARSGFDEYGYIRYELVKDYDTIIPPAE